MVLAFCQVSVMDAKSGRVLLDRQTGPAASLTLDEARQVIAEWTSLTSEEEDATA